MYTHVVQLQVIPARSKSLHRKWGLHHSGAAVWNELNLYSQPTVTHVRMRKNYKYKPASSGLIQPGTTSLPLELFQVSLHPRPML
jgi:hypothetical protein